MEKTVKMRIAVCVLLLIASANVFVCIGQNRKMTTQEYISKYSKTAVEEMKLYRIPASIKLAQGILETASGNSELATKANNHFGIKCKAEWTGAKYYYDDDEKQECFRKYKSDMDSYRDHSLFLTTRERYASLFKLAITDYKGWAYGLKNAGYATSPTYAEALIRIIEENKLYEFDRDGANFIAEQDTEAAPPDTSYKGKHPGENPQNGNKEIHPDSGESDFGDITIDGDAYRVLYCNKVPFIVAGSGDKPEKVASAFSISTNKLYEYNDLKPGSKIQQGDRIFVARKKKKAAVKTHRVMEGESLHGISQLYGIRISSLCKYNQISPDSKVRAGQILKLR